MGAGNVKLAYGRWADLPHAPFRVLVFMAVMSLDKDDPPLFWAGRDVLAMALGRMVPDEDDDETARERDTTFRLVRKATTVLAKHGAISVKTRAAPGRNAVYALHLDRRTADLQGPLLPLLTEDPHGPPSSGTSGINGGPPGAATEDPQVRNGGPSRSATGDLQGPPEEEQEDPGLIGGMKRADLRNGGTGSAPPREANGRDDSSTFHDDRPACPQCGTVLDPDGSCFVCVSSTTWAAR